MNGTTEPQVVEQARFDQDWFLLDSAWSDSVWVFRPTNVLEESTPARMNWNFPLSDGRRFVADTDGTLLQTSRQLIALIRSRSLSTGLAQRATTTVGYFSHLRQLLRWMDQEGVFRFAHLDEQALLQFQRAISDRPGIKRPSLSPSTVQKYLYLLTYLYRFRHELDDGLQVDPMPGRSSGEAASLREADIRRWPYTPDEVAVPLIQGALDLVTKGACHILQARQVYAGAMRTASQKGWRIDACTNSATHALHTAAIALPEHEQPMNTVDNLSQAIDMLYAACFVLISYLVGPRASEILRFEAGCVRRLTYENDSNPVSVIVGAIFKRQPEYSGRPHEWVAPPPAIKAISVLEALSAGHRRQAECSSLWLRRNQVSGATEWQERCPGGGGGGGKLIVSSTQRMNRLLQRFAVWLDLPTYKGESWRLTTHQGRKTFARFTALRDRSVLFALAQHLGHRERSVTDLGYAGTDYGLEQEIDSEVLEQSVAAWEQMLASSSLSGRAGAEIIGTRPHFRGSRTKQDIKGYAKLIVDAGLILGVCDWGYCVYREEHSACLGNSTGPNPTRREPSTCARCKNFATTEQHRPYWIEQEQRNEALLHHQELPLHTLKIARERLTEARSMVQAIDTLG